MLHPAGPVEYIAKKLISTALATPPEIFIPIATMYGALGTQLVLRGAFLFLTSTTTTVVYLTAETAKLLYEALEASRRSCTVSVGSEKNVGGLWEEWELIPDYDENASITWPQAGGVLKELRKDGRVEVLEEGKDDVEEVLAKSMVGSLCTSIQK